MSNTQGSAQNAAPSTTQQGPSLIEEILQENEGRSGLSWRAQYDLLRTQIAKDLTDDELSVLMQFARERGLSVFARQIYGIKRGGKLTIQTGIDGFRLIAARTKEHTGTDDATFEYGAEKTKFNPEGIVSASIVCYRNGHKFAATARWNEYVAIYKGELGDTWAKMPHVMISKCAEALALRKGFPETLGGIHTDDELEHLSNPAIAVETSEQVKLEAMLTEAFERASTLGALRDAETVFKQQEKALLAHQRVRVRAKANAARDKAEAARLRAERERQAPRAPIETGAPATSSREPGVD